MRQVYLASPLGFATSTKPFMQELVRALEELVVVENPWGMGTVSKEERAAAEVITDRTAYAEKLHEINHRIATANEAAIRRSDLVVAVLDGVDVDSGTASEMGFAAALGKQVWGLRTDFRATGENIGAIVNLQVQYWVEVGGGKIVRSVEELVAGLRGAV